jgi:hypothetical protein
VPRQILTPAIAPLRGWNDNPLMLRRFGQLESRTR